MQRQNNCWLLALLVASSVTAQQTPNARPGFRAEGVYDFGGIDQVSIMNGQLTLQIPISRIVGNAGLELPLVASYSNSAWEARPTSCGGQPTEICGAVLKPKPQTRAGLGWRISLGELFWPAAGNALHVQRWEYASFDGTEHALYSTLHPDDTQDAGDITNIFEKHRYTRDGSYLRIVCDDNTPQPNQYCGVEYPSGDVHRFKNFGSASVPDYRIVDITDRFGNQIYIDYNGNNTTWTITDNHSDRSTVVYFQIPAQFAADQPRLVDHIEVPCFVPPGAAVCPETGSVHATWSFTYDHHSLWPPSVYGQSPEPRETWLLTGINLPDGSSYSMPVTTDVATTSYNYGLGGGLQKLTLPTLGRLEWDWDSFAFPSIQITGVCPPGLPPNSEYWNSVASVVARRQFDIGNDELGTWRYSRLVCPAETPNLACDNVVGTGEKLTVTIETPLHDLSEHFFSVYPAENAPCPPAVTLPIWGTRIWEYGMPYTREYQDANVPGETATRFLSSKVYNCPGTANPTPDDCVLDRTTYQGYELDDPDGSLSWSDGTITDHNRRVVSERTVYNSDGNTWKLRTMSDFDGVGHYRSAVSRGNFITDHQRSESTTYNPARHTYTGLPDDTYVQVDLNEAWLLEMRDSHSVTEDGIVQIGTTQTIQQEAKEEFCFDSPTGFLKRHRQIAADGAGRSGNDILLVRSRDSEGNLIREEWFGGDGGSVPTTDLCSLTPPANRYRVDHVRDPIGPPAFEKWTSQWKNSSGGTDTDNLNFYSRDQSFDLNSGLMQSTRDVAGLETEYDFDLLGRLEAVEPSASSHAAWEVYDYTLAVDAQQLARVTHSVYENGPSTALLSQERWQYEGLGRLRREERLPAAGSLYDERITTYDDSGNREFLSEWGIGDTTGNFKVQWTDFDPFGRPRQIRRWANGALLRIEATISYLGDRLVTRRQWIGMTETPPGDETAVDRTEVYDSFGRLASVSEFSGAGSAVTSNYAYDVGNRLRRARTPQSVSGTQDRWWLFDQRGDLFQERSPEKGASGNGDVTYGSFDPLGNAGTRTDGGLQLSYTYDRAGRLRSLQEPNAGNRPWKTFLYDDTSGSRSKGKLTVATGYNRVTVAEAGDANFDARFQDAFQYDGPAGRRSKRTTQFQLSANGSTLENREIFHHEEHFDDAGMRVAVDYPACDGGTYNCPATLSARTVTSEFSRGFLIKAKESTHDWISAMTYHRSGLWNTLTHGNGVVETQSIDSTLKIARPSALEARFGDVTLWRTGLMSYDFSGNLVRMAGDEEGGTDVFLYDKVGRLATARLRMPGELGHFLFSDGFDSGDDARWRLPVPDWSADLHIQTFTFDRFGNLTNVQTVTAQGSSNEPLASSESTNRLTGTGTCYDARGNVNRTGGVDCSATVTGTNYSFDPLNRQWNRRDPDGTSEYFLYSADDERILAYSPLLGPAFRWTLRDLGGKVLRRLESTSSPEAQYLPVRDYIFAGDRVAGTEDPRNPDTSRMHATLDHLGTPRLWTDDSGDVLRKLKYYPFGKQATPTDQWNVALQFTGHERDNHDLSNATDDGDYMHARFHSPLTGRMLSVDPLGGNPRGPQTWNRYAYVVGNPLKYVDPDGRRLQTLDERALRLILAALPRATRAAVQGAVSRAGYFDAAKINAIKSKSKNFAALKAIVKSTQLVTASTAKQVSFQDVNGRPKSETLIPGTGITLTPLPPTNRFDDSTTGFSLTGNIDVVVFGGTGELATDDARAMAHELFGHTKLYVEGRPFMHDQIPGEADFQGFEDEVNP